MQAEAAAREGGGAVGTGATSGRRSRLQAVPGKGIECRWGLNAGGLSQRRSPRGAAAKKQ